MVTTPPLDQIVASFREKVCGQIDLKPEGVERYVVSNPFVHDDGDCPEIVLRRDGDQWALADEGCKIRDVSYLSREQARSTFRDDLRRS